MAPLISLLVIISLSILITRIASIALVHTGISREMARFQARSAFTGVGYTTSEAERIVNHPVRRRILFSLMLLGNAGVVTSIASLLLTFVDGQAGHQWMKVGLITTGVLCLWVVGTNHWIDHWLSWAISHLLNRFTDLQVRDFESILHLRGHYRAYELTVEQQDWLAGRHLGETDLAQEGILVLAIQRPGGCFIGAPQSDTLIRADDTLILYGRRQALRKLDQRTRDITGDDEHQQAMNEQRDVVAQERAEDTRNQRRSEALAQAEMTDNDHGNDATGFPGRKKDDRQ